MNITNLERLSPVRRDNGRLMGPNVTAEITVMLPIFPLPFSSRSGKCRGVCFGRGRISSDTCRCLHMSRVLVHPFTCAISALVPRLLVHSQTCTRERTDLLMRAIHPCIRRSITHVPARTFSAYEYVSIAHASVSYMKHTVIRTLPIRSGSDNSSKSQHSIVKRSSYGCLLGHRFSSGIATSSQTGFSDLRTTSVRYIATSTGASFTSCEPSSQQCRTVCELPLVDTTR